MQVFNRTNIICFFAIILNAVLAVRFGGIVFNGMGWKFARPMDLEMVNWANWAFKLFRSNLLPCMQWTTVVAMVNLVLFGFAMESFGKRALMKALQRTAVCTIAFLFILLTANAACSYLIYINPPDLNSSWFQNFN